MKQIHIIMPFSRTHLKEKLIEAYRPMGVILHPVYFRDEAACDNGGDFNEWSWMKPNVIPMDSKDCKAMMPGCFKRNYFIKFGNIIDDDYYVTADDDDMYEPGVFDAIKQMDDDIVIISMKRGHCIPKEADHVRRYPTDTLLAQPDYVQEGAISAQQSFVKGKIFKQHLHNEESHDWDGELAAHHKESGEQIAYRPDLFALFNYYEPGRWEKSRVGFGVLVNDMMRLDMVFRQSAIEGQAHTIKLPESATSGLNKLLGVIEETGAEIAVLCHQDIFFRQGWVDKMLEQIGKLPESWIVAGLIGKDMEGKICGRIHDMRIPLHFSTDHVFPCKEVSCFDECCIIVNLKKGFRFDEGLKGFDLYGTLAVLQAQEMGGTAWIIDAFAEHYCMRSFEWYPDKAFEDCFKWIHKRFSNVARIDTTVLGVPKDEKQAA